MPKDKVRKGGLRGLDPAVVAWQQRAAPNEAALSKKQRYDRERVRVRLDVAPEILEGLAHEAQALETSQTQLGAFLLAWALYRLHAGDEDLAELLRSRRTWSKAINVKYDLVVPDEVLGSR